MALTIHSGTVPGGERRFCEQMNAQASPHRPQALSHPFVVGTRCRLLRMIKAGVPTCSSSAPCPMNESECLLGAGSVTGVSRLSVAARAGMRVAL